MAERQLAILRYRNQTPSLATCERCHIKFFTPSELLARPAEAGDHLREKFASHTCKLNSVAFYVRRKATHCSSGETSFASFGPFGTHEEARAKQREDEAACGKSEYKYDYRIVGYLEGKEIETAG